MSLSGSPGGAPDRCGILIYTATAGAQGTLGGLVGTAPRFASILRSALERATICSNDPVCADHEPDDRSGDRATHGAACHGCLLIAEPAARCGICFSIAICSCRRWGWTGLPFLNWPRDEFPGPTECRTTHLVVDRGGSCQSIMNLARSTQS